MHLNFKASQRRLIAHLAAAGDWVSAAALDVVLTEGRPVTPHWRASYYLRPAMITKPPLVERKVERAMSHFRVTAAGLEFLDRPAEQPAQEPARTFENRLTWKDISAYLAGETNMTEMGGRYGVGTDTVARWLRQRRVFSRGHRNSKKRLYLPSALTQADIDDVLSGGASLGCVAIRHGVHQARARLWLEEVGVTFIKSEEGLIVPDPRLAGVKIKPLTYTDAAALFSPCRKYRYRLRRMWDGGEGDCLFLMCNPSGADTEQDDRTIAKCAGFAKRWGCAQLSVVNIFALRATDPRELYKAADPVGPGNDGHILDACRDAKLVVCGWGQHGGLRDRGAEVLKLIRDAGHAPLCLKLTKSGQPTHPLYQPNDAKPFPIPGPTGDDDGYVRAREGGAPDRPGAGVRPAAEAAPEPGDGQPGGRGLGGGADGGAEPGRGDSEPELGEGGRGERRPGESDGFVRGYLEAERRFNNELPGVPASWENPFAPDDDEYRGFEEGCYTLTQK